MATYDIRPLQLRMLRVVEAVDRCCRDHGLRYYIWAGTQLGAVRHKGFIPWDDDIDIAMPRPDYEQLIAHSREWLPAPYEFVCAETDAAYPLPFGKIQDASTTLIERPSPKSSRAKPSSMVIPRLFSSARRSGSVPVSASTSDDLPWSMWPAVPRTRFTCLCSSMYLPAFRMKKCGEAPYRPARRGLGPAGEHPPWALDAHRPTQAG